MKNVMIRTQFHIDQLGTCGRKKLLSCPHNHLYTLTILMYQRYSIIPPHRMVKLVLLRKLLLEFASKHMAGNQQLPLSQYMFPNL